MHEQAEAAVALCDRAGVSALGGLGTILRGWALAMQGQGEEGMAQVRQGIAAFRATGASAGRPISVPCWPRRTLTMGHTADGLRRWPRPYTLVEQHGGTLVGSGSCIASRGVLLLRQPADAAGGGGSLLPAGPGHCPPPAGEVLELRAAMSLSRLWQQQGKRAEARELLAPIYGWFTEGFDTADLQEAKALLETLGG